MESLRNEGFSFCLANYSQCVSDFCKSKQAEILFKPGVVCIYNNRQKFAGWFGREQATKPAALQLSPDPQPHISFPRFYQSTVFSSHGDKICFLINFLLILLCAFYCWHKSRGKKKIPVLSFKYLFPTTQWSMDSILISRLYPALQLPEDNTFLSPLTSELQLPGQGNTNHIDARAGISARLRAAPKPRLLFQTGKRSLRGNWDSSATANWALAGAACRAGGFLSDDVLHRHLPSPSPMGCSCSEHPPRRWEGGRASRAGPCWSPPASLLCPSNAKKTPGEIALI